MPTVTISDTEIDQILGSDKQRALAVARIIARRARGAAEADRRNRAAGPPYIGKANPDNVARFDGNSDAGFPDPNDNALYAVDIAALDRARSAHPSAYASGGGRPGGTVSTGPGVTADDITHRY